MTVAQSFRLALYLVISMYVALPTQAGQTLKVLTWEGYADANLVAKFERRYNVSVDVSYVYSDDELWAKLNTQSSFPYDLIAVNTAELVRYIDKGFVNPINIANIPNTLEQTPRFQDRKKIPGLMRNGKVYAIPYTYSEMGLIYNRKLINDPPKSINAMWDKAYQGKVLTFNTSNHNFTLAAISLGFPNPFQQTEQQLAESARKLVELRRNILTFYSSPQEVVNLYKSHEIALIYANYGTQQLKALLDVGADVGYVLPEQGTLAWLDCWAVTSKTQIPLAESWINFMLESEPSQQLTNLHGLANTLINKQPNNDHPSIVWLQPIAHSEKRNLLWERIISGDTLEHFH